MSGGMITVQRICRKPWLTGAFQNRRKEGKKKKRKEGREKKGKKKSKQAREEQRTEE